MLYPLPVSQLLFGMNSVDLVALVPGPRLLRIEALPLSLLLTCTSEPGPEPVHGPADLEVFRVLPSAPLGSPCGGGSFSSAVVSGSRALAGSTTISLTLLEGSTFSFNITSKRLLGFLSEAASSVLALLP